LVRHCRVLAAMKQTIAHHTNPSQHERSLSAWVFRLLHVHRFRRTHTRDLHHDGALARFGEMVLARRLRVEAAGRKRAQVSGVELAAIAEVPGPRKRRSRFGRPDGGGRRSLYVPGCARGWYRVRACSDRLLRMVVRIPAAPEVPGPDSIAVPRKSSSGVKRTSPWLWARGPAARKPVTSAMVASGFSSIIQCPELGTLDGGHTAPAELPLDRVAAG
jgi:hypothetical protein